MFGLQILFFIILAVIIIKVIITYIKNENSPIISIKAKLICKNRQVRTRTDSNGMITRNETLRLKFQLDTGSELELTVGTCIFRNVPENQWGTLTFQGTRFLKFQWENGVVEK
ncbi:DUF2500 family protein [Clostridium frigidicarnis]|uniref:DUF2500 domain-containing protein n=1 Tax=Clostridium frigidicarnis TaxID=84698 RepID=A0A1I0YEL7_9CLOT|nr:DUF2500 family protein [Clostridium frigidicarnis]SFB11227.1 Protein of unknown function [Clostridium frigidicarnis]